MSTEFKLDCFECGTSLQFYDIIPRKAECDSCGGDVRVCRNCKYYDPNSYNECRETSADSVKEKERANFCDYFEPGSGKGESTKADELRAAAEALFKGGS